MDRCSPRIRFSITQLGKRLYHPDSLGSCSGRTVIAGLSWDAGDRRSQLGAVVEGTLDLVVLLYPSP